MFAPLIEKLQRREDLTADEAAGAMGEIMDGRAQPAQIAGLLIALSTAFVPVLLGKPIMTHYPGPDRHATHIGSLELTTPFLFDVGVFLLVMGVCVGVFDLLAHATRRERS